MPLFRNMIFFKQNILTNNKNKKIDRSFKYQILKNNLILFKIFAYSCLLIQCNSNHKNYNKEFMYEIDSLVICNFVNITDVNPTIKFYLSCEPNFQDSLFLYRYLWDDLYLKEKSHFWIESESILFDLQNINSFESDTTIILIPNKNYSFVNKMQTDYKLSMKSLSEILNKYHFFEKGDFKIKFWSIKSNDTIVFKKSKSFKIILKLDDEEINPNDSIKMNLKIQPPEINEKL